MTVATQSQMWKSRCWQGSLRQPQKLLAQQQPSQQRLQGHQLQTRLSHLLQCRLQMKHSPPPVLQELLVAARKLPSLPRAGLWDHIQSRPCFHL